MAAEASWSNKLRGCESWNARAIITQADVVPRISVDSVRIDADETWFSLASETVISRGLFSRWARRSFLPFRMNGTWAEVVSKIWLTSRPDEDLIVRTKLGIKIRLTYFHQDGRLQVDLWPIRFSEQDSNRWLQNCDWNIRFRDRSSDNRQISKPKSYD